MAHRVTIYGLDYDAMADLVRKYQIAVFGNTAKTLGDKGYSVDAFLEEEQLLRDAALLNGIPGVLIAGRYDVSSPLEVAWRLSQRWSTSELVVLPAAGHGGEALPDTVIDGLARLAPK